MDSAKTGTDVKSLMIIAIKGSSSSEKSEIAIKLVEFLEYPLIDEEDITPSLQNSLPNSSSKYDDLPFQIVTQISSTQLRLKLRVIISTQLSQRNHFEYLLQLASSKEARLIIIECGTQVHQNWDSQHVTKLNIYTTKPLEEAVPEILTSCKTAPFKEAHAHEFSFRQKPKVDSITLRCNYCNQFVSSGPTYQCIVCKEFTLHKKCAKLPKKLELLSKVCPSYLRENPPEHKFPKKHKCNLCERFSSSCHDCLLHIQIKLGFLPTILPFEGHQHPLNFIIMPLGYGYQYKCFLCDKLGKSIGYKCYKCKLDLHIDCAINNIKEERKARGGKERKAQEIKKAREEQKRKSAFVPLVMHRHKVAPVRFTEDELRQVFMQFDLNRDNVLSR
ncbi:hypothetical protein P3X46_001161 [Hevea brasiliensis]|uniref:EF-hand domain-containing protein n=1 Tax=Hevea brasiliensis TaxID=3981 RepID=A0ABQ9NDN0_HEVBR|nr:hypothetical protein P3X46_001161 [Hevea brasiliensis]